MTAIGLGERRRARNTCYNASGDKPPVRIGRPRLGRPFSFPRRLMSFEAFQLHPTINSALNSGVIRKAEQESVSAFALRLGVSRNTLGDYEKGKQPIPKYIALAVTCIYRRMEPIE